MNIITNITYIYIKNFIKYFNFNSSYTLINLQFKAF
jgi:hypothetical protein